MTEPGFPSRLRSRRVALAAGGVGAALVAAATIATPTETIAAFTDEVWSGAGFSASQFGVEISLINQDSAYASYPETPLTLKGEVPLAEGAEPGDGTEAGFIFGPPITLAPGDVTYAGFFIRRTSETTDYAEVTVSGLTNGDGVANELWNSEHLTFAAKYAPVAGTSGPGYGTICEHMDDPTKEANWKALYDPGTLYDPVPATGEDAKITLGEPQTALRKGEPYMICFKLMLDENVVTGTPAANGQTVNPVWTFNAESVPAP